MVELIYIFLIAVIALGLGRFLLRSLGISSYAMAEELPFALGLGLGTLALTVMALGFAHLLYEEVFYLLLLAGAVAGGKELLGLSGRLRSRIHWTAGRREPFVWALLAGMGLLALLGLARALTPAHGAVDPLAYHLALPKIFLQKHYLSFEPTITGALYPSNIGMLYTLAIGLRGEILAQLMHWLLGMATVLGIVGFCRRYFDTKVGLWAAAIFLCLPVVAFFMPLGYIDVGVGYFQFLACWALFNWLEEREERTLLLAALLTGLALGAKHPALPMWVVAMVIIAIDGLGRKVARAELMRHCLLFGGLSLCLLLPWYGRSFLAADNPVWPLANGFFGGFPYGGTFSVGTSAGAAASGAAWLPSAQRVGDLAWACLTSLWSWSWNMGDWQRSIGAHLLAFLPGLLIYARTRKVVLLAGFCAVYYLIVVLYVDGNPRYSIFLFAYLSIAAGYVAEQMTRGTLRPIGPLLRLGFCASLFLNVFLGYALAETAVGYLFSGNSREQFLLEHEPNARVMRQVNTSLPAAAKVLIQGDVKGYYCDREYLWDHPYQMVINYRQYDTPEKLIERMQELGITHVVRMIYIPPIRTQGVGYPQYFADPFHEAFRKQHLKLLYKDDAFVLFEVMYPASAPRGAGQ